MTKDLSDIPDEELIQDLAETQEDIVLCEFAIAHGVETYNEDNSSVLERLNMNKAMEIIIKEELERRGVNYADPDWED